MIERDLQKKFPDDPDKVRSHLERAKNSLDRREAEGKSLPDINVREERTQDVSKQEIQDGISAQQVRENAAREQRERDKEPER